nr:2OG-Fe(II) oxygenase [Lysobacter enzymogenes]
MRILAAGVRMNAQRAFWQRDERTRCASRCVRARLDCGKRLSNREWLATFFVARTYVRKQFSWTFAVRSDGARRQLRFRSREPGGLRGSRTLFAVCVAAPVPRSRLAPSVTKTAEAFAEAARTAPTEIPRQPTKAPRDARATGTVRAQTQRLPMSRPPHRPISTPCPRRSKFYSERIAAAADASPHQKEGIEMNAAAHTLLPSRADAASSAARAIERPLPASLGACALIHGVLDAAECAALIAAAEARGFAGAGGDYPPSYRNNDRQVLDDPALAQRLFERLREYAPAELADADGTRWRLASLNERLRLCRYRPGQRFNIHQDGVHHRGPDLRSRLTFMIYLTDGDAFVGGDTLFYARGPGRDGEAAGEPLARVRPRAGTLILFDHALWHAGEAVTAGVKHLLRSDLMYQRIDDPREAAQATHADAPFAPGHDGYVWTLARLADGRIASAGRDAQVRLWSGDGRERARLRGHAQSVLGLCELPGARLATVSRDRCLRVWSLDDGRCLRSEVAHDAAALCLARLGDGRLASGAADGRIALWRDDGEPLGGWATQAGYGRCARSAARDCSAPARTLNWRGGMRDAASAWPASIAARRCAASTFARTQAAPASLSPASTAESASPTPSTARCGASATGPRTRPRCDGCVGSATGAWSVAARMGGCGCGAVKERCSTSGGTTTSPPMRCCWKTAGCSVAATTACCGRGDRISP